MLQQLINIARRHYLIRKFGRTVVGFYHNNIACGVKIKNFGCTKIRKHFRGRNNQIIIGKDSLLDNTQIRIVGNNCRIIFGDNVIVGPDCSFWLEGNDIFIKIGDDTTFNHTVHFCAQEDGSRIIVGKDCQFSLDLIVRTSDSHPIYDTHTRLRINNAASVNIGDHVWIAPGSRIFKGVSIGNNAVIGSNSLVTHDIPADSLAVGSPAKVIKTGIHWTREHLF